MKEPGYHSLIQPIAVSIVRFVLPLMSSAIPPNGRYVALPDRSGKDDGAVVTLLHWTEDPLGKVEHAAREHLQGTQLTL